MFSFEVDSDLEVGYLYVEPRSDQPVAFTHCGDGESIWCDVDHHGNLKGIELLGGKMKLADLLANYPNLTATPDPAVWREISSMVDPVDVNRLIRRLSSGPAIMRLSIEFGRPCLLNFLVPRPVEEESTPGT